jgi:ADP-ribosyl-[dinitrogen reductase] hydrolase
VEVGGFDLVDQLKRYLMWRDRGYMSSNGRCFDIGITVGEALLKFERTGEPFSGVRGPKKAGNGSLMRVAPVPLFFAGEVEKAIELSGESSRTTHQEPATLDACRYMGALIVGALQNRPKEDLLADRFTPIAGYWSRKGLCPEIDEVASGSFKRREPPEIRGSGHVVRSLEAALWAFWKSDSFAEGCLLAVNLGDDADTTGAIYGQLAGAFYGDSGIPASWRDFLAKRDLILNLADRLYQAADRSRSATAPTAPGNEKGISSPMPFSRSYWVLPDKLLAGAYPGAPTAEEEERKLRALLDLGVTCFVNLMEESETAPDGKPIRQYAAVMNRLSLDRGLNVVQLCHPIKDVSVPSREKMTEILNDIDAAIAQGRRVYVHCLGGRGRTGTVIGCWLVRHGIASPRTAVQKIHRLRARTPDRDLPSPETQAQRLMVEGWRSGM